MDKWFSFTRAGATTAVLFQTSIHLVLMSCHSLFGSKLQPESFRCNAQGGIGPAGLATEDLHVLDFTDFDRPRWHRRVVAPAADHA